MMLPCSFCVEVCAGTRRIVQAGHALERGTAEQPQRSNALKLYIFGSKWLEDSVLTEVIRLGLLPKANLRDTALSVGTHSPDTLPKVLGFIPSFFHIKLKNKAHRLWQGACFHG